MADYPVNNDDRVKALSETALPYFVHWRVVMKLLCIPSKEEFDAFIEGIKAGGRYSLGGKLLPAINIDAASENNILHLHRLTSGRDISAAERNQNPITDTPSLHVTTRKEVYFSVGLIFHDEWEYAPLKDQIMIIKIATGLEKRWADDEKNIQQRMTNWRGCYTGGDAGNRSYYNTQLPMIIVKHHRLLRMEQMSLSDVTIEMMDRARDMIAKMMEYSHVLEMRLIPKCIVRRSSKRGTEEISSPTSQNASFNSASSSSRMSWSKKKQDSFQKMRRRRTKRSRDTDNETTIQSLGPRFESIAAEEDEESTQQQQLLNQTLTLFELGVISNLWDTNDPSDRIEVGRREILARGAYNNDSYVAINETIRQYGGLPFSLNQYNVLISMKRRRSLLLLKVQNFDELKARINEGRIEFRISADRLILDWVDAYIRCNNGNYKPSPRWLNKDGTLKPWAAACFRHILYAHPKIGWVDFPNILNEMAVLFYERSLEPHEFPSISTIRSNIAMIDNFDRYDLTKSFKKFLSTLSPLGNMVYFGGGNDGTIHGKADYRNVSLIVSDDGPTEDMKAAAEKDDWHKYKLNLSLAVGSAAKPLTVPESNVDALAEICPAEHLHQYQTQSSDNAPAAIKEARETVELATQRSTAENAQFVHGVEEEGTELPDTFHIAQLGCSHFSVACMGETDRSNHDQTHHLQFQQSKWNHWVRNPELYDELSTLILGKETRWRPKEYRHIRQRWGQNSTACKNSVEGFNITNEEGDNFWKLLFQALRAEHGDWRQGSCDEIIVMAGMDAIKWGCIAEIETGRFFNDHILWHALPGELCSRPGFRTLELVFEFTDKFYPYVQSLQPTSDGSDPPGYREHFPLLMELEDEWKATLASLDDDSFLKQLNDDLEAADEEDDKLCYQSAIDDRKKEIEEEQERLRELIRVKREQLEAGVKKARDEFAKLTESFLKPKLVVLFFVHPIHGPGVLRSVIKRAIEGGLDMDDVWEGDEDINKDLITMSNVEWGHAREYTPRAFEEAVYDKLEGHEKEMGDVLRRYGFYQAKARDDMKLLSLEFTEIRSNKSTHRLHDFYKDHQQIFDLLHSRFARTMSSTRPTEAAHGFQKKSYDGQRTTVRNDAQLDYTMRVIYIQRAYRRHLILRRKKKSEAEDKAVHKTAPKHNGTKLLAAESGRQLDELAGPVKGRYTEAALASRYSEEYRKSNSVKNINKLGMRHKNKAFAASRLRQSREKQAKRKSHHTYVEKSKEEYDQMSRARQTDHDRNWAGPRKAADFNRATKVLSKKFWQGVDKDADVDFMSDFRGTLPVLAKFVQSLPASKRNAKYLLRVAKKGDTTATPKNCVVLHVALVKKIVNGKSKMEELLPTDRCLALANASKEDKMAEFVKVDQCEHLANIEHTFEDGMALMRNVIEANGDEYVNLNAYAAPDMTFPKQTISYRHKSIDEEEWEAEAEGEARAMELREEEKDGEEENEPDAFDDAIANAEDAVVEEMALGVNVGWWDMPDDESGVDDDDDGEEDDDLAEEETNDIDEMIE